MQQGGLVDAKLRSLTCTDFEYIFTIPISAYILPHLRSCYHPLFLRLRIIVQVYMYNNKGCHRRLSYCMHMPIQATYMFPCTNIYHHAACIHPCTADLCNLTTVPIPGYSRYLGYEQGDI